MPPRDWRIMDKISWPLIGLIALIGVGLSYLEIWVIKWAVSLFYPITMWQAFGAFVLLTIIGTVFKRK